MTLAGAAAQTAIKTASGGSINTGIWTLVGIAITAICGVWIAYIKQWGPWKQGDTDARAADFARLRAEIDGLKKDHKEALEIQNRRIEKLENEVERARDDARKASSHAMRSDAKLQTALTACEVLLGLVEREMPEAKEIALVKRLLAQAASDDLGVGDGMRKLAVVRGVGE
jgi:hypothetical protein